MTHPPLSPYWAPAPPPPRSPGATVAAVLAVLVGILAAAVAVLLQLVGWAIQQFQVITGQPFPVWVWPLLAVLLGAFAGLPALLVWQIPRSPAVRAAGRAFTLGTLVAVLGSMLRAIPLLENEAYLAAFTIGTLIIALLARRRGTAPPSGTAIAYAVVAGLLSLIPYLWLGALGGTLEIVLGITAAITAGLAAGSILDGGFWSAYADRKRARLVLVGGLTSGVTLTLIAAGLGASGTQLAALFVLPPLGFAAAALAARFSPTPTTPAPGPTAPGPSPTAPGHVSAWGGLDRATAVLIAIAAFGPLALLDPDELTLFLIPQDAPYWAMVATGLSFAVAVVLALAYPLALTRLGVRYQLGTPEPLRTELRHSEVVQPRTGGRTVPVALAAILGVGAGVVYAGPGQPGVFGEQLFVVMKSQATLAGVPAATGLAGRPARVAAVYRALVDHANATQGDLRSELDRLRVSYRPYYLVNGVRVAGGPGVRAWLSRRDDVARVLVDPVLRPLPEPVPVSEGTDAAPGSVPWNIAMVGAPQAWAQGVQGAGITVGSSDSGVDGSHPALAPGFRGGDDSWFDPWSGSTTPTDHGGHGTHTLGSAVGGLNIGVAPKAQWIGCVNLERNLGSTSHYLDCLQFMLAPFPLGGDPFTDGRPARAPHVLTNSWGCPPSEGCDGQTLASATDAFAAAGIAFVAAAGNTGPYCDSVDDPPAPYRSAFTVAAVNESGTVADFSSRGTAGSGKPDVAAPGEDVLSAMPGGTYQRNSGTSMATPHVAGVIALLWSAHPELVGDLARTADLVRRSARPARTAPAASACSTEAAQAGAGIVNIADALRLAAAQPGGS